MRRMTTLAAIATALVWTGATRAESTREEAREAGQETREAAREAGRDTREAAREAGREVREEAREARSEPGRDTRTAARGAEKKHPLFEGKNNFDLDGKVSKVSRSSITVQREGLPAATLMVSKDTKVEVGGEHTSISQLRQGQDVKASFNLQGDKPMAVEIKADRLEQDDRREMRERQRDTQRELQERRQEAQQPRR